MKFTYMLAGYERSCHDARIMEEATAFHGFSIPSPGKFYVADSRYANKDCFFSPFRRETYNLPEYQGRHVRLGKRREVGDPILEEYATDSVPVGGHVNVNMDYVLADEVDDTGPSTGRQQDASRRGAMNQLRDMLANDMWDRYQQNPWSIPGMSVYDQAKQYLLAIRKSTSLECPSCFGVDHSPDPCTNCSRYNSFCLSLRVVRLLPQVAA
ncbi:hypothetical protein TIFTF001_029847 [Ficus carica]|uniref:DDE Tnp4 domain-containing protein n=1 Tax=Ficus carica TaxID=3494 RepID=A0AA88J401_FICCA|nr:hypothetical protein TIFTF001_029847 [Ficus carica]